MYKRCTLDGTTTATSTVIIRWKPKAEVDPLVRDLQAGPGPFYTVLSAILLRLRFENGAFENVDAFFPAVSARPAYQTVLGDESRHGLVPGDGVLLLRRPQRAGTDGDSWGKTRSGPGEQREEALQEQLDHINILS